VSRAEHKLSAELNGTLAESSIIDAALRRMLILSVMPFLALGAIRKALTLPTMCAPGQQRRGWAPDTLQNVPAAA
jgi:hypothetical protein